MSLSPDRKNPVARVYTGGESHTPRAILLTVLGVAIVVRIFYLLLLHTIPEWSLLSIDNHYYHNWAQLLASDGWRGEGAYFRAPLYPMLLSFWYTIFGSQPIVAHLFGMFVSVGAVLLTTAISTRLFGSRVGLIAGLIHAVLPVSLYFDHEILSEGLMVLLILAALYFWLRWRQDHELKGLVLCLAAVLLASLTRPVALLLLPAVSFECYRALRLGWSSSGWKVATSLLVPFVLLLTPLVLRNVSVHADPFTLATQGGINFYLGNNAQADGVSAVMPEPLGFNWQLSDISLLASRAEAQSLTPEEVSQYWSRRGLSWIASEPLHAMQLLVTKFRWMISAQEIANNRPDEPYLDAHPLLHYNPVRFGVLFPLAVIGLLSLRKQRGLWIAVLLVCVCFVLVLLFFLVSSRFRFPLVVTFLPFVALGSVVVAGWIRNPGMLARNLIPLMGGAMALLFAFLPAPAQSTVRSPLHATAGLALMAQSQPKEALMEFRKDQFSGAPEAALNIGNAWLAIGKTDSAVFYYQKERTAYPDRPKAWTNLASVALSVGNTDSAVAWSRAALVRKNYDPDAHNMYLRALASAQMHDSLVSAAQQAVGLTHRLSLAVDASALLIRDEHPKEAVQLLAAALQFGDIPYEQDDRMWTESLLTDRASRPVVRAKAFQNLSTAYLFLHATTEAVAAARLARELTPDSIEAKGALLLSLHEAGLTVERDDLIGKLSKKELQSSELQGLLDYVRTGREQQGK